MITKAVCLYGPGKESPSSPRESKRLDVADFTYKSHNSFASLASKSEIEGSVKGMDQLNINLADGQKAKLSIGIGIEGRGSFLDAIEEDDEEDNGRGTSLLIPHLPVNIVNNNNFTGTPESMELRFSKEQPLLSSVETVNRNGSTASGFPQSI